MNKLILVLAIAVIVGIIWQTNNAKPQVQPTKLNAASIKPDISQEHHPLSPTKLAQPRTVLAPLPTRDNTENVDEIDKVEKFNNPFVSKGAPQLPQVTQHTDDNISAEQVAIREDLKANLSPLCFETLMKSGEDFINTVYQIQHDDMDSETFKLRDSVVNDVLGEMLNDGLLEDSQYQCSNIGCYVYFNYSSNNTAEEINLYTKISHLIKTKTKSMMVSKGFDEDGESRQMLLILPSS